MGVRYEGRKNIKEFEGFQRFALKKIVCSAIKYSKLSSLFRNRGRFVEAALF